MASQGAWQYQHDVSEKGICLKNPRHVLGISAHLLCGLRWEGKIGGRGMLFQRNRDIKFTPQARHVPSTFESVHSSVSGEHFLITSDREHSVYQQQSTDIVM